MLVLRAGATYAYFDSIPHPSGIFSHRSVSPRFDGVWSAQRSRYVRWFMFGVSRTLLGGDAAIIEGIWHRRFHRGRPVEFLQVDATVERVLLRLRDALRHKDLLDLRLTLEGCLANLIELALWDFHHLNAVKPQLGSLLWRQHARRHLVISGVKPDRGTNQSGSSRREPLPRETQDVVVIARRGGKPLGTRAIVKVRCADNG